MLGILRNIRIIPKWLVAVLDIVVFCISGILGYAIRFNFEFTFQDFHKNFLGIIVFMGFGLIAMIITKSYDGIIRLTGLKDIVKLAQTVLISVILVELISQLGYFNNSRAPLMPTSVIVIAGLIALVTLVLYRFLVKEIFLFVKSQDQPKAIKGRVALIFGAGEAGMITHEVIKRDSGTRLDVVGFLDDDPKKDGKQIDGKTVFKGLENLELLVEKHGVSDIIIAIQNLAVPRKREITESCLRLNLQVSIVPPVSQWVNGGLELNAIREVKIEDLLGRDQISLNRPVIKEELEGKVVLVTGAAGTIGKELCLQIVHYQPKLLLLLDQSEAHLYEIGQIFSSLETSVPLKFILADIKNKNKIQQVLKTYKPNLIFHAAAYKHVPMMENHPEESINNNVIGTKVLADLAVLNKVEKFVLVSTDKAVNPTNVMGATKRAAEIYVQALNEYLEKNHQENYTKFVTTRFGNVLGSSGSVIPLFKSQIYKGGPVTVTHPEITRYFMTIPEACQLVLEAGIIGNGGEVFVFDMGEAVKIIDLAKKMIQLSGRKVGEDIQIVFTGLRDGEKLYEELLNDSESVGLTHHPKILIARVQSFNYSKINGQIEMFFPLLEKGNEGDIVAHLKTIVPEFISNSSRFQILDRMN
ncbi:polysaccharide biosynthesis protein [Belliella sp. DSM 111904]|uniref:Polysaccharide biosynthesis protein n=1 Tax=Belliella filtrata TaxID=2923435 RepID=A0ABS9V2A8_9BACT|nr:nucleoside-diphosphate sugar epimerase/dehydratase [Belliella filtrata]MCH7410349.1 polysaccharide biosynthesis protein [Belliella filtrata]